MTKDDRTSGARKKSFNPWRFGATTIPPELRSELSSMQVPDLPTERRYRSPASDPIDTSAAQRTSQIEQLVRVETKADVHVENTQLAVQGERRHVRHIYAAALVIAAVLALGIVWLMPSGGAPGRPQTASTAAAAAISDTPSGSSSQRAEPALSTPIAVTTLSNPATSAPSVQDVARPVRPKASASGRKVSTKRLGAPASPTSSVADAPIPPAAATARGPDLLTPLFPVPERKPR